MCMSCGCGEENERHKPAGDIVLDDLKQAAKNHDLDVAKVAANIQASAKKVK